MASARTRALGLDAGLGAFALVLATLAGGLPVSLPGVAIAGFGTLLFVVSLFVAERFSVVSIVDKNRPASLILAGVSFSLLGFVLAVGRAVVVAPSATLLWGCGLGLCAYRSVFGLLYPIPERRLRQAKQWGELPGPDEPDEPP